MVETLLPDPMPVDSQFVASQFVVNDNLYRIAQANLIAERDVALLERYILKKIVTFPPPIPSIGGYNKKKRLLLIIAHIHRVEN